MKMINLKVDKVWNLTENNWKARRKSRDRKHKKMNNHLHQEEELKKPDNRLVENLLKRKIEL